MERKEFNIKLKVLFPKFILNEENAFDSTFLSFNYESKEYRLPIKEVNKNSICQNKCTIKEIGHKYIYISSEMYKGEERNFFYCLFKTRAKIRGYRCKNFNDIELNKKYFSTKTLDELLVKIEGFNSKPNSYNNI